MKLKISTSDVHPYLKDAKIINEEMFNYYKEKVKAFRSICIL